MPLQDGRWGEFSFRIKPIPSRGAQRIQTNLVHTRTQGPPQRLRQNCVWASLMEVRVSGGTSLLQGQRPWVPQTWVCHKPSWRRLPLPYHRAARIYTGLGNRLSESGTTEPCVSGPGRKEQWPHRRLPRTCLWVPRRLRGVWVRSGLLQGWGHWV